MRKILHKLESSNNFWFLLFASVFFFFIRLPSFFEPYWYGDEGIYEVLGFGIRHGRLLYRDIWDNKPPLLYLIYALFNGDQVSVRIFSFVVGLAAVIIFFYLTKKLFAEKMTHYFTTGIFALLLGLPLIEGNIANAENFMILPSIAAGFLIFTYSEHKILKKKQYLLLGSAGLLLGISFLIKVVAVFDVAAFWVFLFIVNFKTDNILKLLKQTIQYSFIFLSAFLIPLLVTILFFAMQGSLRIFFQSAFFSNVDYVNYGNQFIIPQGLLIAKLLLLGGVCLYLLVRKHTFSKTQLFIYSWLAFSLFSALFSQRPYTHYLLVAIASFSLFLGFLFKEKKQQLIHAAIAVLLIIFAVKNFWFYSKTFPYYINFIQYVSNQKSTESYREFFDKNTTRDYDVAAYLQTVRKPSDPVFIWGNSAQIYKLINALPPGRFTVAYHITNSHDTILETQKALIQAMPKYVIILQNAGEMPYILTHYSEKMTFDNALIYERTY